MSAKPAAAHLEQIYVGSRRKHEPAHTLHYVNFTTGGSVQTTIDDVGRTIAASFGFPAEPAKPEQLYKLSRTGTELIAGERCAVVLAKPDRKDGVTYSACVTHDGVLLRDTAHYRDGDVMEESVALKVERRAVADADILPPRNLLDWGQWDNLPTGPDPILTKQRNYTLSLAGDGMKGARKIKTFKADGTSFSEAGCSEGSMETLRLEMPQKQFSFIRGDRLTISRRGEHSPLGGGVRFDEAPLDEPPGQALGETCRWIDAAANVCDYSRHECRAGDGLPLTIQETSWSSPTNWNATEVERGRNLPGSVTPPKAILSWAYWGWP